jgi:hypothetical protein
MFVVLPVLYELHVKTTDRLIHNSLYTSVGFTVETTEGEMILARGCGWGVEGKVCGAVRACWQ